MSTEPSTGHNEEGHGIDPSSASLADLSAPPSAAKAAEASMLFDKLFAKSEPTSTVSAPKEIPPPVQKKDEPGETFLRKVAEDAEGHTFQRVANTEDDHAINLPDRFVDTPKEMAVPPPRPKSDDLSQPKTQLAAQVKPTAVDTVVSDQVKAEIQAKVQAAKYAAKPEINFPVRINNLKTQNDQLRARLASLE
jgi:hypothetical protein